MLFANLRMIKNELAYFNTNIPFMTQRDEDTRRNSTVKLDYYSMDNYDRLKTEEMSAEISMHREYISNDIVPLMLSDTAIFAGEPELLKSLVSFGANCVLCQMAIRYDSSPNDHEKLAAQFSNDPYQKLIRELRLKPVPQSN
jgi:hypothetical protein